MAGTVVFFDLDGTLSSANSGSLYARELWKEGLFSTGQWIHISILLMRYRLGLIELESVMESMIRKNRGQSVQPAIDRCLRVVHQGVLPGLFPGAVECVAFHRARGDRMAILSASSPYIVEPVAEFLEIPDAIATPLLVNDGRFTGEFEEPLCYGAGKIEWAERYCRKHGTGLEKAYFYSDSISDAPLLEKVGFPYVVRPDWPLRRLAKKRNWPILDWSRVQR